VGLFGTVWGIMHAFTGLAQMQQVTLAKVAPGIAEALVATAAGLILALTSLIPYNGFMNRVEKMNLEIGEAASELVEYAGLMQEKKGAR
jgi:biopolymer transport protein TolQ